MNTHSFLACGSGLLAVVSVLTTGADVAKAAPPVCCGEVTPEASVPPGYRVVEGDILIRIDPAGDLSPAATFKTTDFWPGGNVPYVFDTNVSQANRDRAIAAMAEWEAVANVNFFPRNGQADYVHIQDSDANNSEVGRVGGKQIINITSWTSKFVIVHELGHCLGFWHEQSRSDRGSYITVNWDNIEEGKEHNFDIKDDESHYGPYDFDSVMHYGACGFSTCSSCSSSSSSCRTITVKEPYADEWQSKIGQRDHLSKMDALTMSFLYPESNWRFLNRSYTGLFEFGTFLFPAKTFTTGKGLTPEGGTLWIQPGSYATVGTHSKAMTLRAPLGGVTLSD